MFPRPHCPECGGRRPLALRFERLGAGVNQAAVVAHVVATTGMFLFGGTRNLIRDREATMGGDGPSLVTSCDE